MDALGFRAFDKAGSRAFPQRNGLGFRLTIDKASRYRRTPIAILYLIVGGVVVFVENNCPSNMQPVALSKADSKVLAQVFDPESGPAKVEVLVDPSLPGDQQIKDEALLAKLRIAEREAIQLIESYEMSKDQTEQAKDQAYRSALLRLDNLIAKNPSYASARNNRAQLRRWRFGDRNMICQRRNETNADRRVAAGATVDDLKQCISLASPGRSQDPVSPSQGRLLAQTYTQLGALYYAASKDLDDPDEVDIVDEELKSWAKDRFEEEASRLFYLGGLYGNEVAKALAVHTNPHAKLCGSIVKEAMRKELAMSA